MRETVTLLRPELVISPTGLTRPSGRAIPLPGRRRSPATRARSGTSGAPAVARSAFGWPARSGQHRQDRPTGERSLAGGRGPGTAAECWALASNPGPDIVYRATARRKRKAPPSSRHGTGGEGTCPAARCDGPPLRPALAAPVPAIPGLLGFPWRSTGPQPSRSKTPATTSSPGSPGRPRPPAAPSGPGSRWSSRTWTPDRSAGLWSARARCQPRSVLVASPGPVLARREGRAACS
jgi:hypothetical protein